MKHLRSVLLVALLLLAAFSVWGQKAVPEPKTKVKLDFWFQDWQSGVDWWKDYIVLFEKKHPNVDLNLIPVPFQDLVTKFIPSIAQGNEADIMFGYDEWLLGKDVSKLFTPLTPTLMSKEEFQNFIYTPPQKNVTAKNGNIYGLPFLTGANAFGFTYHKDLFKQAGVSGAAIKSWDDLKTASKKLTLTNADGSIKRSGMLFTYTEAANALLDMIQMQGARAKLLDVKTKTWNFNIPEAKKAMETFQWFVDNKTFDPQSGDPFQSFPNKLGAMLLIGPWNVGSAMTTFPELDVGYILMPPFPTAKEKLVLGSVVSYGSYFLSKRLKGDKLNGALLLIRDLLTNPAEYCDISFYHKPPYWVGAIAAKKYVDELTKRPADKMNEYSQTALTVTQKGLPAINTLDTLISEPILIRQVMHPEMTNVWLGKKSIDETLKYMSDYLTKQEKELAQ